MKFTSRKILVLALAVIAAVTIVGDLRAAPPSETFMATSVRTALSTVLTMTAAGPSTLVTSPITVGAYANLTCAYNGTSHTGTPANVVTIQGQVPGTTNYYPIIASSSIATDIVVLLSVGTTMVTATNAASGGVPANSAVNQVLPAAIRIQVVLGTGTAPTTTGTVSCYASS